MVVREVLDNGLRLITETMPHVRSVTIGVWLMRGSRHESDDASGIAHFVEHMLFKGTDTRSAGGHRAGDRLDRRPARRVHREGIRQLLHQGARRAPAARGRPAVGHRAAAGVRRRGDRAREEGDPRRDQDGRGHARRSRPRAVHAAFLGRASARPADSRVEGDGRELHRATTLREYFRGAYVGAEHDRLGGRQPRARRRCASWSSRRSAALPRARRPLVQARRRAVVPQVITRTKELEQSHICLGTNSYPQSHDDRYVSYILNTRARRLDELAAVPERAREARPRLFGVQRPERLSRRRQHHDLRRLRQRRRRGGRSTCASRSCAA